MVFTVARLDWDALYKHYLLALESEPDLSAAEFARRNELNINSARRSFNKIKAKLSGGDGALSATEKEGDRSLKKGDRSLDENTPVSTNKAKAAGEKKPAKTKGKADKIGEKAHGKAPRPLNESDFDKVFDQLSVPSRRKVTGDRHRSGEFRGVRHGAYMDLMKLDPELIEAAVLLNEDNGVPVLMSARYLQLRKNQSEMLLAIETSYENDEPWTDELGNVLPRSKAEGQALFGTSKVLTELEAQMESSKKWRAKQASDEIKIAAALDEAHPLSRVQRIQRTKHILQYRTENDLSAVEASYIFESEGIEIPRTLVAEADKEISLRQPAKEDAPEVTAEELDQMMLDYQSQRDHWDGDWLAERKAGIEELKTISASDAVEVIE